MITLKDIGDLADGISKILPPEAQPIAKVFSVMVRGADGMLHEIHDDVIEDVKLEAAREQAAGAAANKAAHLAGLNEAIARIISERGSVVGAGVVEAICAEVARRFP